MAAGSSLGTVTIFDITTRRMQAVQRFQADDGPVSAMAACLPQNLAQQVALAQVHVQATCKPQQACFAAETCIAPVRGL